MQRKRRLPRHDKSDQWRVGGGSETLNAIVTRSKCPDWTPHDGVTWADSVLSQAAPWKMLREGVYTILSFSIAMSICSLPSKSYPCWSQNDCCFWPLLQSSKRTKGLSVVLWETFLWEQKMSDSRDSTRSALRFWTHPSWVTSDAGQHLPFNADVPATSPALTPSSCPFLTANHLPWPCVFSLPCVCLPIPLVFVGSASSAAVYA